RGAAAPASGPLPPEPQKDRGRDGAPARKSKHVDREIKAIQVRLAAVEAQIHEMEARLAEIGLALADPDLYRDGTRAREIAQARKDTEERVAWLMKEWEDLSLRLSAVSGEER
ncbi:MAG TPA: ABC transporter C-terminal domain-containing protein, partial [Methylomirabilota bacterium]|nr:ABC transporter C-terminal domain-containing protein [Methylomirabilota bacterium]